jgi:drug/metabolite transporter (DMT)-like permease
MGIGEWAALSAALLWTSSTMIWGRIPLTAMALNLSKNIIAVGLILIHILALAVVVGRPIFQAPGHSWLWLGLSGLIGVAVGDTLYFRSLQILGPRRALMMATTSPLFAVVLGALLLGEDLRFLSVSGIVITVAGVIVVVADRKASKESPGIKPGRMSLGIAAGVLAAICQAIGGVLSKKGMVSTEGLELCDPIEATFIRLFISAIGVVLIVGSGRNLGNFVRQACKPDMLKLLIPATALGTWLGIWMSQIAFRFSEVAIAQTLLSTCPLFAIPIVWLVHKHRVTILSFLGTIIAIFGIAMTVNDGNGAKQIEPKKVVAPAETELLPANIEPVNEVEPTHLNGEQGR